MEYMRKDFESWQEEYIREHGNLWGLDIFETWEAASTNQKKKDTVICRKEGGSVGIRCAELIHYQENN